MRRGALAILFVLGFFFPATLPAQHESGKHAEEERVPVQVPSDQQTRMGLRTGTVTAEPIRYTLRAPAVLATEEGRETHFHTRVSGWIEEIYADSVGKTVKKGDPLFSLYSPDLVTTQAEYVAALKIGRGGREVAEAALKRLRYFGVPEREIAEIAKTKEPKRLITFESPINGYIVSKNAIRGLYVTPDIHLYYLADLSHIWVLATLYEADMGVIRVGDEAKILPPNDPATTYAGRVSYIYPDIQRETRTGKARIEVHNPEGALKPGMYVNVAFEKDLGTRLVVPEDSVIDTGVRKLVFVQADPTRFEPREIKVGPRVGGKFAVLEGLKEGETIVTGANFLLDAESKLQAAIRKGLKAPAGHGGGDHEAK